jgi:hypothetical protein
VCIICVCVCVCVCVTHDTLLRQARVCVLDKLNLYFRSVAYQGVLTVCEYTCIIVIDASTVANS